MPSSECPVFCQTPDVEEISEAGFDDVRPVGGATRFGGVGLSRTDGRLSDAVSSVAVPADGQQLKLE